MNVGFLYRLAPLCLHMWTWLEVFVMVWYSKKTLCTSVHLFCSVHLHLFVGCLSIHYFALFFRVAQETVTSLRWNIPRLYSKAMGPITVRVFPDHVRCQLNRRIYPSVNLTRKWDWIIRNSLNKSGPWTKETFKIKAKQQGCSLKKQASLSRV